MISYNNRKKIKTGKGFTLIEVLFAILLVGIAISAIVMSSQTFTQANGFGIELSTADFLIEEIRERTASTAFDDLPCFAGTYSPPQDVEGNTLNNFTAFSQQVGVEYVSETNFEVADPGSDFVRVTVNILLNGNQINSASWIRARL